MLQQSEILFIRFRLLFASVFIISFFLIISALVTNIGAHSRLAGKAIPVTALSNVSIADSSNAVTDGMYSLLNGTYNAMLSATTSLYKGCRNVTTTTSHTGTFILRGGGVAMHGVAIGAAYVAHGISSGIMFTLRTAGSAIIYTLRIPGKIMGSISHTQTVSAIIRPTADQNPVPVINNNLSPALLARLTAQAQQDQQKSAALQAAQLIANQHLGGVVVAGDAKHGGYPSQWDAPMYQDSRLDSWGMYNRECVSYAAWKVYQTYGDMPYWGGVGNANQWISDAKTAGIATGTTPRAHAVAISMQGYYGHAMWVEQVSGNMIYVSQYNYDLHGHYSEMWVNASSLTYIYFK